MLFVLAPLAVTGWYLWGAATDQYASNLGFTIRQEETGAATELRPAVKLGEYPITILEKQVPNMIGNLV